MTTALKLYLMRADDADDATMNLDWFVVAPDIEEAKRLWRNAVRSCRHTPGKKSEMIRIRMILDDVTGTPYDGKARYVPWENLKTVWSHDPNEPIDA